MMKIGQAAQSTGWIVSSQSRVRGQFFRSRMLSRRSWRNLPRREATSDYRNLDQKESEEARGVEAEVCETILSFPACWVRTSPWTPQDQLMMKIGQAAQSTGWIVSSQSRVQAAQSTGWIVSSQRQFFRSCFLRTSQWGCWGPLTYQWWSGSGSTLGSCPAVSWGSSEPTMYELPEMGGKTAGKPSRLIIILLQAMHCRDVYYSPAVQRCPPTVDTVQRRTTTDHAPVCAVLTQVHADAEMFPRRSWWRRTQPRRSWRSTMLPRRPWRSSMLPKEVLEEQDVTKEILEEQDVPEEILEEQKERSHADPTTTLVWVGLWQSLIGLIPTLPHIFSHH